MQYTYAKFCRKAPTVRGLFVSGFLYLFLEGLVVVVVVVVMVMVVVRTGKVSGSVETKWTE